MDTPEECLALNECLEKGSTDKEPEATLALSVEDILMATPEDNNLQERPSIDLASAENSPKFAFTTESEPQSSGSVTFEPERNDVETQEDLRRNEDVEQGESRGEDSRPQNQENENFGNAEIDESLKEGMEENNTENSSHSEDSILGKQGTDGSVCEPDETDMTLVIADVCSLPQESTSNQEAQADVIASQPLNENENSAVETPEGTPKDFIPPNNATPHLGLSQTCAASNAANILQYKDNVYSCGKCHFTTRDRVVFQIHIEKHPFSMLFKCLYCTVLSDETHMVIEHIEREHPGKDSYYTCICTPASEKILKTLEEYKKTKEPKNPETSSKNVLNVEPSGASAGDAIDLDGDDSSVRAPANRVPPSLPPPPPLRKAPPALKNDDSQNYQTRLECFYKGGYYICKTCKGGSSKVELFAKHVNMHLHGKTPGAEGNCPICQAADMPGVRQDPMKCPLVRNMIDLLHKQRASLESAAIRPGTSLLSGKKGGPPPAQIGPPLPQNVHRLELPSATATPMQNTSPLLLLKSTGGARPVLVIPPGHIIGPGVLSPTAPVPSSDGQATPALPASPNVTSGTLLAPLSGNILGAPNRVLGSQPGAASTSTATQSASANLFSQKKNHPRDNSLPSNTIVIEPIPAAPSDVTDEEQRGGTQYSEAIQASNISNTTEPPVPQEVSIIEPDDTVIIPTGIRKEGLPNGEVVSSQQNKLVRAKVHRPGILSFKHKSSELSSSSSQGEGTRVGSRTSTPTPLSSDVSEDAVSSDGPDEGPIQIVAPASTERREPTKTRLPRAPPTGKRVVSSVVKCSYQKGLFVCDSCEFSADGNKPKVFRRHLWKEVHPQKKCSHCPDDILYNRFMHCPIINQLMKHLEDAKEKAILEGEAFLNGTDKNSTEKEAPGVSSGNSVGQDENMDSAQKGVTKAAEENHAAPSEVEAHQDGGGEPTQEISLQCREHPGCLDEVEAHQESKANSAPRSPVDGDSDSQATESMSNSGANVVGNNFQDVIAMIKDLNENNPQEAPTVADSGGPEEESSKERNNTINEEGSCEDMFVISNVIGQATDDVAADSTGDKECHSRIENEKDTSEAQVDEDEPSTQEAVFGKESEDVAEASEDDDEDGGQIQDPVEAASHESDNSEEAMDSEVTEEKVDESGLQHRALSRKEALSQTCRRQMPYEWTASERKNWPMPTVPESGVSPDTDSNKVYVCCFFRCSGWSSVDPVGFKIHNLLHHSTTTSHACSFCQRSFANEDNVITHIKEQHSGPRLIFNFRRFHCGFPDCWYVSEAGKDFKEHIRCHHAGEEEYPCCFCQIKINTVDKLIDHITSNVVYSCPLCTYSSGSDSYTKEHIDLIHSQEGAIFLPQVYICCHPEDVPQKPRHVKRIISLVPQLERASQYKSTTSRYVRRRGKQENEPQNFSEKHGNSESNVNGAEGNSLETRSRRKSKQKERDWDNMEFYGNQAKNDKADGPEMGNIVDLTDALQAVPEKKPEEKTPETPEEIAPKKTVLQSLGKGNEVYCQRCSFLTTFRVVKAIHERAHSYQQDKTRQLWCPNCPYSTDSLLHFKIHVQCHIEKMRIRLYRCSYCPLVSNQMDVVEDHHEEKHPDSEFKSEVTRVVLEELECPHCPEILRTELELLEHLETGHGHTEIQKYLKDMYAIASLQIVDKDKVETVAGSAPQQHAPGKGLPDASQATAEEEDPQSGSDRFQCPYCTYSGFKCGTWTRHMQKHIGMGTQEVLLYCCKSCKWKSTSKKKVIDHCKLRHNDIVIEIQNFEINGSDEQTEVGAGEEEDEEAETSLPEPLQRQLISTEICRYHCDFCEFSTNERSVLEGHWKDHEGQTATETWGDVCEESTVASPSVTTGLSDDETIDDDVIMDEVDDDLPEHATLKKMLENLKGDEKRAFKHIIPCLLCPYQSDTKKHMRRHIDAHMRQFRIKDGYRCGYCAYSSTTEGFVTKHLHRYHPELPKKKTVLGKAKLKDAGQLMEDNKSSPWVRKPQSIIPVKKVNSESVPSLPPALSDVAIDESEIAVPEDMIFKTPEKCPKCNFTTKVRYNFVRHLKTHDPRSPQQAGGEVPQSGSRKEDDISTPRVDSVWSESAGSSNGACGTDITIAAVVGSGKSTNKSAWNLKDGVLSAEAVAEQYLHKEREGRASHEEAAQGDMTPESMSQSQSEIDVDSSSDEEDPDHPRTEAERQAEQALYCVQVAGKNLLKCTHCVFMHKYASKVRRHFVDRHEQYCPFQCGHCPFKSVETTKVRQHILLTHQGLPVCVLSRTGTEGSEPVVIYNKEVERQIPPLQKGEDLVTLGGEAGDMWADNYEEWLSHYVTSGNGGRQTCKLCGYRQDGDAAIKRHVLTVHLRHYPYRCHYCAYCAVEPSKILRHLKKLHPNEEFRLVRRRYMGDLPDIPGDMRTLQQEPGHSSDSVDVETGGGKEHHNISDSHLLRLLGEGGEGSADNFRQATPTSSTTENARASLASMPFGGVEVKEEPVSDGEELPDNGNDSDSSASGENSNMDGPDETKDVHIKTEPGTSKAKRKRPAVQPRCYAKFYKCDLCSYTSKWNLADVKLHVLSVHLRIHPYSCRYCCFGCPRRSKLVEHLLTQHPGKPDLLDRIKEEIESALIIETEGDIMRIGLSDRAQEIRKIYQPNVKLRSPRKPGSRTGGRPKRPQLPSTGRRINIKPVARKSSPSKVSATGRMSDSTQESQFSRPTDQPLDLSVKGPSKMVAKKSTHGFRYPGTTLRIPNVPKPYPGPSTQNEVEDNNADVSLDSLDAAKEYTLWKCKSCGRGYVQKIKAQYHFALKHLNLKPYICNYCSFGDETRKRVVDHMVKEHAGQEVVVFAAFREHALVQKKVMPVKVDMSEYGKAMKGIKFISASRDPKKRDKVKSAMRCPVCASILDTSEQLDEHIAVNHCNYTGFKCSYCGVYIKAKQKMKYHLSHRHPDEEFKYQPIKNGLRYGSPLNSFEEILRRKPQLSPNKKSQPSSGGGTGLTVALPFKRPKQSMYKSLPFKRRAGSLASQQGTPTLAMKTPKRPAAENIPGSVVGRSPPRMIKPRSDVVGGTVWLNCCHCSYTTLTSTLMRHHIMSHLNYRPYRCPHCSFGGVRSYQVKKHMESMHPNKANVHKYIPDTHIENTLKEHFTMKVRKGAKDTDGHVKPYRLKRVHANTESSEDIPNNEEQVPGPSNQMEPLSKRIKQEQVDLQEEFEEETLPDSTTQQNDQGSRLTGEARCNNEVFVCVLCGFRRPSRSSLLRHIMWELNYRPWCCPYCIYRDVTLYGVKRHCFQQHPEEPFKMVLKQNPDRMTRIHSLVEQSKIETGIPDTDTDDPMQDEDDSMTGELGGNDLAMFGSGEVSNPQAHSSVGEMAPIYEAGMMMQVPVDTTVVTSAEQLKEQESKQVDDPLLFQCPKCSFAGYNKSCFRKHLLRHGPKRFMCGICNHKAIFRFDIYKHHNRAHGKKILKVIPLTGEDEVPIKSQNKKVAKKRTKTNVLNKRPRPLPKPAAEFQEEELDESTPKNNKAELVRLPIPVEVEESGKTAKLPEGAVAIIDGMVLGPDHLLLANGIFSCRGCNFKSPHRENAKSHVVRHFPVRLKCGYCNSRHRLSYVLRRHVRDKHPGKPFRMTRLADLPTKGLIKPIKATQVKQSPSRPSPAKKTKPGPQSSKGKKSIPTVFCCFYCSFKTHSTPELEEHQKLHATSKANQDAMTSPSKSAVITAAAAAVLKTTPTKSPDSAELLFPLKCGYCSFSTSDKNEFNLHRQTHMVIKPYKCGYCDYTGFVRGKVRSHCENIHRDQEPVVIEQRQQLLGSPPRVKPRMGPLSSRRRAEAAGRAPPPFRPSTPRAGTKLRICLEDVLLISQHRLEKLLHANHLMGINW